MVCGVLAASPKEQLKQYVAELQNSPNDQELREKIIKLARKVKPPVPEEMDELLGVATAAFKSAKTQADYADAVGAFEKVTLLAPWIGSNYFNLGVAQEKAGQFQDSVNSFRLYLIASPNAKDAKKVRARIGGLKFNAGKKEKYESFESEWVHAFPGKEENACDRTWHILISRDSNGDYYLIYLLQPKEDLGNVKFLYDSVKTEGKNIQFRELLFVGSRNSASSVRTYNLTLSKDGKMEGTEHRLEVGLTEYNMDVVFIRCR